MKRMKWEECSNCNTLNWTIQIPREWAEWQAKCDPHMCSPLGCLPTIKWNFHTCSSHLLHSRCLFLLPVATSISNKSQTSNRLFFSDYTEYRHIANNHTFIKLFGHGVRNSQYSQWNVIGISIVSNVHSPSSRCCLKYKCSNYVKFICEMRDFGSFLLFEFNFEN